MSFKEARYAQLLRVRTAQGRFTARQKAEYAAMFPERFVSKPTSKKKTNPAYWKKRQYGLSQETFLAMLARQEFRCVVCNRHESELKKPLQIDHDHKTKRVRGLLCYGCNVAIGMARDNPAILRMCALYLEYFAKLDAEMPTA
jgi:hypothetical protein